MQVSTPRQEIVRVAKAEEWRVLLKTRDHAKRLHLEVVLALQAMIPGHPQQSV
jgi:hypothetical protein